MGRARGSTPVKRDFFRAPDGRCAPGWSLRPQRIGAQRRRLRPCQTPRPAARREQADAERRQRRQLCARNRLRVVRIAAAGHLEAVVEAVAVRVGVRRIGAGVAGVHENAGVRLDAVAERVRVAIDAHAPAEPGGAQVYVSGPSLAANARTWASVCVLRRGRPRTGRREPHPAARRAADDALHHQIALDRRAPSNSDGKLAPARWISRSMRGPPRRSSSSSASPAARRSARCRCRTRA